MFMNTPQVYLVGAGPGDAGLITLKGIEALGRADVVIYDFLANERLLEYARKGTEKIYVGKKGRFRHIQQDEITGLMIDHAKRGRRVVRLKGGDPFVFGRGAEEALALVEEGITFEVVPGVTSAISVPAYAGIPLTHRDYASSVTFLTGQEGEGKRAVKRLWESLSIKDGTLVILMGWKRLGEITKKLIEEGRPAATPVAVIRWGTLAKQRCIAGSLEDIAERVEREGIKPPVIIVVGEIVGLREKLNWYERRPLFGRRIVVTRTQEQAGRFSRLLEEMGADVITFPTIKMAAPVTWKPLDRAIKRLSVYDYIIFTSVNGVRFFFERLYKLGYDVRRLGCAKLCAIGPATEGALVERGFNVDVVPEEYRAEGILEALGRRRIGGKRFLLPRAEKAREVLPEEIRHLGGSIDVVPVYRTVRPRKEAASLREFLRKERVDVVTFTSSSTVSNFVAAFRKGELTELLEDTKIACIGPITEERARSLGLEVHIVPREYTIPAFAGAIAEYFGTDARRKEGS